MTILNQNVQMYEICIGKSLLLLHPFAAFLELMEAG